MYSSCFEENSIIPYRFMVALCLILVTTVKVLVIRISFGFCTDGSDTRDSICLLTPRPLLTFLKTVLNHKLSQLCLWKDEKLTKRHFNLVLKKDYQKIRA